MSYTVVKYFTDLQDNNFAYHEGDTFPREGLEVSDERIKELSTTANRRGVVLIEKVEEGSVEQVEEEVSKKASSEPKKDTEDTKAGVSPSKATKTKKSTKKTQE